MSNLIGNYDRAGWQSFTTHELDETEHRTRCGLYLENLRGDWQMLDDEKSMPSCKNCLRGLSIQESE